VAGGPRVGHAVDALIQIGESSMRNLPGSYCGVILAVMALLFGRSGWSQAQTASLLTAVRQELHTAGLSEKEIQVRLRVVANAATVKAYYPHAGGTRPEARNQKHWELNQDGSYIPRGRPTQAVRDLWTTESGIRCAKLSALVMIKAMIDVADENRLAELDDMLRGKVIPNELPQKGIGTLFDKPKPRNGDIFQTAELLPGDEVWFENPYFDRPTRLEQRRYVGQEGHHVFYVGGDKVMDMYSRKPLAIESFRTTFLDWKSVKIVAEREHGIPKAAEFQIKSVRRVIVDKS
jgi:hypothetical protein